MLNNISTNSYINKNSFFHKLNPFIKIISILLFLFISIYCNYITSHILIISTIIILILISKIPIKHYLKSIIQIKYFLIILFIFNLFFVNIIDSTIIILRLIEIILYTKIILYTTKVSEMNRGFSIFCYPLKYIKINPDFISMSITLTIRFIPIVINEINSFIKNLKTKGIYFTKNIKQNIMIIKKIMIPILTRSINKADTIASMMEIKGFSFNKKRSSYFSNKVNIKDILFIIILIVIFYFIIRGEIV